MFLDTQKKDSEPSKILKWNILTFIDTWQIVRNIQTIYEGTIELFNISEN